MYLLSGPKGKKPETLNESLVKVNAEALVDALAYTLAEFHAKTLRHPLLEVKTKALLDSLTESLSEVKAKRHTGRS